jgi:hypothetical protein
MIPWHTGTTADTLGATTNTEAAAALGCPAAATSGRMAGDASAAEAKRGVTTGSGTGETEPGPTDLYRYQHIIFNVL